MSENAEVRVWDPFVRVFHWLLLASFVVAYISEGDPLIVHTWAGYVAASLIGLRIIWGFGGTRHARFADFLYPPSVVFGYARDLLAFRSRRYIGHSPAGGAMILLLMASIAATTLSGMALLAEKKNAGPLAPIFGRQVASEAPAVIPSFALVAPAYADKDEREDDDDEHKRGGDREESAFEDVHEFFANLTLFLACFHLAGVVFASYAHRENLVRSMITGRKRPETPGH